MCVSEQRAKRRSTCTEYIPFLMQMLHINFKCGRWVGWRQCQWKSRALFVNGCSHAYKISRRMPPPFFVAFISLVLLLLSLSLSRSLLLSVSRARARPANNSVHLYTSYLYYYGLWDEFQCTRINQMVFRSMRRRIQCESPEQRNKWTQTKCSFAI